MMKKKLLLSIVVLAVLNINAQIGIQADYLPSPSADSWSSNDISNTAIALPGAGFQASIDYRLKLKNIRIEFHPGLGYGQQKQDFSHNGIDYFGEMAGAHFFINTRIYPLDLEGDCDCPTWRKEGPTLEKGLFFQLSPGLSYFSFNIEEKETNSYQSTDLTWFVGGGLGFDIGINDLLTITPTAGLRYYPSANWESITSETEINLPEEMVAESEVLQYHFGIRLGFHLWD